MKWQLTRALVLVAALLVAACQDTSNPLQPAAQPSPSLAARPAKGQAVPGQYIVVFADAVVDPAGLARGLVATHGGALRHTYSAALKGFAARLPDQAVAALRRNPQVAYVEQDQIVGTDDTESMDANGDPWGLDRIDQRSEPLSGTYSYTANGAGVNAYIIDTGIWTLHADFGGRADNVYDAVTLGLLGGLTGEDCNGHGTHVSGTIGGIMYGVAKGVALHGVRVLNCSGVGLNSDVIAGVDWVTANHRSRAVANMSLGGGSSAALNAAVTSLWNSGVFLAVAAGNDDADACSSSPAGAAGVFTVAASERNDAKASYSNWGSCVEAYAPGSDIKSDYMLGLTMTLSGTSMATPHVTGVAALYKATFGDAPSATVANWILNNATAGVITGSVGGTPNLLLFKSTL